MNLKPMHKVFIALLILVLGVLACEDGPGTYEITFADGSSTTITAYSCYSKASAGAITVYCFSKPGLSDPDLMMSAVSFRRK